VTVSADVTGSAARLAEVTQRLRAAGFNLGGCLGVARYDGLVPSAWRASALLPETRTAVVLGAGGRAFYDAFRAAPEGRLAADPMDAYTRRVAGEAAERLDGLALLAFELRGGCFADFVALGRAAGLGAASRLGLLLHPVFGPWMSLRALVLTPLSLPESRPLADFDPCPACAAPCAAACHGQALAGARFDPAACAATRERELACRHRCDARRACVIGPEHRYGEAAEAHHMGSLGSP